MYLELGETFHGNIYDGIAVSEVLNTWLLPIRPVWGNRSNSSASSPAVTDQLRFHITTGSLQAKAIYSGRHFLTMIG